MRSGRSAVLVGALGTLAVSLGGCAGGVDTPPEGVSEVTSGPGGAFVVATTTVLGDIAGQVVACGGGEVRTLMPVGADPHDFAASSADVGALVRADLVVANGLGLEEGLESALDAAAEDGARILEIAPAVDPIPFGDDDDHADDDHADDDHADDDHADDDHADDEPADDGHGHGHGSLDPHVWLDVSRMATAATLIGAELAEATGEEAYRACGEEVRQELSDLDVEVREILSVIPSESRRLVTDHDAFGYFAEAYDMDIVGVVIPGGSTLGEPSSADLAALVRTIQETGAPAIVTDVANPSALASAVAVETGRQVAVVELHEGSLGPAGSEAGTYAGMMLTNAQRLADVLAG